MVALRDGVDDVLAVDEHAQRPAVGRSLFSGIAVEHRGLHVEYDVVGAQVGDDVELGVVAQVGDFIGGNGVDEVQIARVVGGVDSGVVSGEHELQLFNLHVIGVPVVGVLGINHMLVMHPLGQHERAAGHIAVARVERPGVGGNDVAVGILVALGVLDRFLVYRIVGRESDQIQEVGAGLGQHHGQGQAVLGRGGVELAVGIAVDDVKHILVVGRSIGVDSAVPGVDEVVGVQLLAIGPLQTLADGEGVGQAVLGPV